jgi:hypothetical protein
MDLKEERSMTPRYCVKLTQILRLMHIRVGPYTCNIMMNGIWIGKGYMNKQTLK